MLRVVHSQAIAELQLELIEGAKAVRKESGPFEPTHIAVPNIAIEAYLKYGFARFMGIAAHLHFERLPSLLDKLVPARIERATRRNFLLAALLDEKLLEEPDFEPIKRYIDAGGEGPEVQTLRRMQLFRQVDRLFENYLLYRPDVLQRWAQGPVFANSVYEEAERWQRALWLATMGSAPLQNDGGPDEEVPKAIHVFGFTHLAPGTVDSIGRLAERANVTVYLRTTANGALSELWGQPALETVRRLTALPQVERVSVGPEEDHLPSIELLACASVRRELEAIATHVWTLLQEDTGETPLRFNDIAVVFPSSEEENYQSLIGSVLSEAHDIPVTYVTRPVGHESRLLEVIQLLIGLPLGRLTRESVLRFALHPAVSPTRAVQWTEMLDAAGVACILERGPTLETYLSHDADWSPGLKRLALGAFALAAGDNVGTKAIDANPEVLRFSETLRAVLLDIEGVRDSTRPLPSWMGYLASLITTHVETESEEDERIFRLALHTLHTIGAMNPRDSAVPYRVAYELVSEELSSLRSSLGNPLVGGVNVAPLDALHGVSFRVTFVAGLNAGSFPATAPTNPLDLREAELRPGDLGPRARDRSQFLETLLSTRDKVYLSYVSRDALTGDRLEPSSVFLEVRDRLGLTERDFPVSRYEDATTYRVFPRSRREAISRELGRELRYLAGNTGEGLNLPDLRQRLSPRAWRTLRQAVGIQDTAPSPSAADGPVQVPVTAIRRFLECPLQGSTRYLLRMYEQDDTSEPEEDEVFHTSPMDRARILRASFRRALSIQGNDLTEKIVVESLDATLQAERAWGRFPPGVFGRIERQNFLEVLLSWRAAFERLQPGETPLTYCFGPKPDYVSGDVRSEPVLEFDQAILTGTTQDVLHTPRGSLILATREKFSTRELLKGFLDHVLISAAEILPESAHASFVLLPSAEARVFRFVSIPRERARQFLTNVLEDMLSGVHEYLLPFEIVYELAPNDQGQYDKRRLASKLRFLPENLRSTSSLYGPVRHPERFLAPEFDTAIEILERRFGLLFSSLERDEAP